MMHRAFLLLLLVTGAQAQPAQPMPTQTWPVSDILGAPQVTLTSGRITARIALPDLERGFYRGTRFDQAGVITRLKLGDREFYGPWFERTAPDVLDYVVMPDAVVAGPDSAVSGPVEEFAPLDFKPEAGSRFVKIGVGLLLQPDTQPYDHYRHYQIADGGTRQTRTTRASITFIQTLAGAYDYEKTLRLSGNRLIIEHRLKNFGTEPIRTTVYDHNFLRLVPGNGGITVTAPFAFAAANPPASDLLWIDGKTINYLRPMKAGERFSFPLTGYGISADDYAFKIAAADGASVEIKGDQPLAKLNLFSIDHVQAVEPYIAIDLTPGSEKRWSYTYAYSAP
jgi:hypothetical protein